MSTADCEVRARVVPGGGVRLVTRNLSFDGEGQLSLDTTATRPSALDLLVAALATDLLHGLGREAARAGLPLYEAEFTLAATLASPLAALGVVGEPGSPAVATIRGTLYASADTDEAGLRSLWEATLARAPVHATLARCVLLDLDVRLQP